MAKRSLATRQKLIFRGPAKGPGSGVGKKASRSPRNPFVVPALQRKAGPHDKSSGAKRQQARRVLRNRTDEEL